MALVTYVVQVSVVGVDAIVDGSRTSGDSVSLSGGVSFTAGTGASAAQVQWGDYRTMGGASEDLDLAGSLVNGNGKTVTFTDVKSIAVKTDSTNAGNVTLRFNPTNGFSTPCTGDIVLPPGTTLVLATEAANGWTATAGTGDILRVLGASGYKYEIAIAGEGSEA